MVFSACYHSPLGRITLAAREDALVGLWLENQKYFLGSLREPLVQTRNSPILAQAAQWLDCYFAGQRPNPGQLPLAPVGSEFQKLVWELLCQIPYGQVTTYGALAKEVAAYMGRERMSAQAVGGAVGHNPISIMIPCHRVVGSNGSLTGYAGGVEKKIQLLTHEGVDMTCLFAPKGSMAP